jgi:hypothetical protein
MHIEQQLMIEAITSYSFQPGSVLVIQFEYPLSLASRMWRLIVTMAKSWDIASGSSPALQLLIVMKI